MEFLRSDSPLSTTKQKRNKKQSIPPLHVQAIKDVIQTTLSGNSIQHRNALTRCISMLILCFKYAVALVRQCGPWFSSRWRRSVPSRPVPSCRKSRILVGRTLNGPQAIGNPGFSSSGPFSAAWPTATTDPTKWELTSVSTQVTSHTNCFPCDQGGMVIPSGRLLSSFDQSNGSKTAGIWAKMSAHFTMSFSDGGVVQHFSYSRDIHLQFAFAPVYRKWQHRDEAQLQYVGFRHLTDCSQ